VVNPLGHGGGIGSPPNLIKGGGQTMKLTKEESKILEDSLELAKSCFIDRLEILKKNSEILYKIEDMDKVDKFIENTIFSINTIDRMKESWETAGQLKKDRR